MECKSIVFLVESGKPLEMVKQHIAEYRRVAREASHLATELGISKYQRDRDTGVMTGAYFEATVHPDFKKPNRRGVSYPKRGSQWERRLSEQVGYENPAHLIAEAFGIALSLQTRRGDEQGWRAIGSPLSECGFLWITREGPYGIWAPDVEAEVAMSMADGWTVTNVPTNYKVEIPGARRITREEWDYLVAKHKLEEQQRQAREEAAAVAAA